MTMSTSNDSKKKSEQSASLLLLAITAGIVVPIGNPKTLSDLESLTRPGIRLSLAERSAAIGKHTWDVLEKSGKRPRIRPNVVVTKPTVNNIIEDVATDAVDATIAWDAVTRSFPELEWIPVSVFSANPRPTGSGADTTEKPE